jgi:hypothetical protein
MELMTEVLLLLFAAFAFCFLIFCTVYCIEQMQAYGKPPDALVNGLLPPGLAEGMGMGGMGSGGMGGEGFDEAELLKQLQKASGGAGGPSGCPTQ